MDKSRLLQKVLNRLYTKAINIVSYDTNKEISNTILVTGTTRSGTTYLMENLNSNNDYRLIFEPFNNTYTKEWKLYPTRHYINKESVSASEEQVIQSILSGNIRNDWTDQFNKKIRCNKRLIKAVRANLLIPYIRSRYPLLHIIHIVRNPYDVVASRINMNFDQEDYTAVLSHNLFLEIYYSDINFDTLKDTTRSKEAKHAALWCLENRYLLRSQKLDLTSILYKDIIGKSVRIQDDKILMQPKITKPSASSTDKAKYHLSKAERDNIKTIIDLFGMKQEIEKII